MKLTKQSVTKKIHYFRKLLNIDPDLEINISLSENNCQEDLSTMADIQISLAYNNACITLYSPAIKTVKELDKTLLHELLHLYFEPFQSLLRQSMGKKYQKLIVDMIESTIEKFVKIIK